MRHCTVGDRARNADLDFGTGSNATPDRNLSSDLPCAFSHTRQAIVAGASLLERCLLHTLSVIPNAQPKLTFCVNEFGFNVLRTGVAVRISQGLTRDAIDLIPDDRVQVVWWTCHRQLKGRAVGYR